MKKNLSILALLLAALLLLSMAGCGASSSADYAPAEAPAEDIAQENMGAYAYGDTGAYEEAAYEAEDYLYDDDWDIAAEEAPAAAPTETSGTTEAVAQGITPAATAVNMAEKIIYSAYAEIETTEYDKSIDTVYRLMEQYGAFLESSAVNGNNLNAWGDSVRSASLVLRVPREHYSALTGALSSVGNVTYLTSNAENITSRYTDTESRLNAYEVEEQRLLDILAQAETVEDMIDLESRLSDIRYEKESLTSQLRTWDTQVAYSKVDLFIREVKVLTPEPEPEPETYWEQVGAGFMNTLRGLGRFFMGLFRVFVAALPVLIPLAVIALVIVILVRRSLKKQKAAREKAAQVRAKAEAEYAREHEQQSE